MTQADVAVIGMAVMGKNLALNLADSGQKVAVYNRSTNVMREVVAENPKQALLGVETIAELVKSLSRPRRILVMVKAGGPVDAVINELTPLLEEGDVIIDGGNTYFPETQRRERALREKGLCFVGMGVSGGEEGARFGPSMMPGGAKSAWEAIGPMFEAISAKTESGPCVTHVGPDGAGHFVKMVHNGIEYGDMQLIAEVYDVMGRGLAMGASEIGDVFGSWNLGRLSSFLIEITAKVLGVTDPDTQKPLVDMVLDRAGQKGTGKWTVQIALDHAEPIPTIAAAIDARVLSSLKGERLVAEAALQAPTDPLRPLDKSQVISDAEAALFAAKVCSYTQGLRLIHAVSQAQEWGVDLKEMARIWKGGCIIRARLLDTIMRAYEREPKLGSLLLAKEFANEMQTAQLGLRRIVSLAAERGIPVPAMSGSLAYFDAYRTGRLPQNLTQAQRDAFGAHTYERTDRDGAVHTDWLGSGG